MAGTEAAPKVVFHRKVDLRNRDEMIRFLIGHERYRTMNSWNELTSYANNVKVNRVIPDSLQDRAFELIAVDQTYEIIGEPINAFGREHGWRWQIGWNGRSSGYLVLYAGERRLSKHKSWCPACGQKNFTEATDTARRCGACGRDSRINREIYDRITHFHSVGDNDAAELVEWSMDALRDEVRFVQSFDLACDAVVDEMIALCLTHHAVETTVMVPTVITILEEVG